MVAMGAGQADWPEAMATVLTCEYDVRAGRAIAFGLPSSKHFHITYNYWAGDALHTGDFFAAKALPQGSLFPIKYNPDTPHENSHAGGTPSSRSALIAFGVAGSIVLSLLWFFMLRGCS